LDGLAGLYTPENVAERPILELGARCLDAERYRAFKTCYQAMRVADDIVDDSRANASVLTGDMKRRIGDLLIGCMPGSGRITGPCAGELEEAVERYDIPAWTWLRWTESMLYDLDHNGFTSFRGFLRYSEGAAVAPGAIFLKIIGYPDGPGFCVFRAARPLAIFSYLVHIVRDFRKDQASELNYFADDLVAAAGLDRASLNGAAKDGGKGRQVRYLLAEYLRLASRYRARARQAIDGLAPHLSTRCLLSLEIIFGLYSQLWEGISSEGPAFPGPEYSPTPAEIHARIVGIIRETASGVRETATKGELCWH
jgi:phytoene/squalene synthetase